MEAESDRGSAIQQFDSCFHQAEAHFKKLFKLSQDNFADLFRGREAGHSNAEMRREQDFQASLELFGIAFQYIQSSFSNRAQALEDAEIYAANLLKDYASEIFCAMKETVRASRKAKNLLLHSLRLWT